MEIEKILYCCKKGKELRQNMSDIEFEVVKRGEEIDGPYLDLVSSDDTYILKIYCSEHSPKKV